MKNQLLFELGTEEIPAGMISRALSRLRQGLDELFKEAQVDRQSLRMYASPRRLAIVADGLPDRQPDRHDLQLGPPESVAFDEHGNLSKAAHGFARKMKLPVEQLERIETERGTYLGCRLHIPGKPVPDLVAQELPALISSFSWPKNMYWRESRFRFIRPLRWFVLLWNDAVIPFEFEGVSSGRITRGHRSLGNSAIELAHAGCYVEALRDNFVLVELEERRSRITAGLTEKTPAGMTVVTDPELLETVLFLNEFPTVICGKFDPAFLEIPREVLITVMRHHQKYFAVEDAEGNLAPCFLTVANTNGDADGRIRNGHQKVLRARLADAAFFWEQDRKTPLKERLPLLRQILFQEKLGSYYEKTERIRGILEDLAWGDSFESLDQAAQLCKADLTTEMVRELPELQGIMGGLYARREGEPEAVWRAIYEHYQPVSLDDSSPSTREGASLSIADRIDTIVGCFSIGLIPTGSSDPFALRRQAQGLVKILLDHRHDPALDIALEKLVDPALAGYAFLERKKGVRSAVLDFLIRRIRFLLESRGFAFDVINAVMAVGAGSVRSAFERAQALSSIRGESDFEAVAVAFKRIKNILAGQDRVAKEIRTSLFREEEERKLHQSYLAADHNINKHRTPQLDESMPGQMRVTDWDAILREMASLREPVDRFFDKVLVMAEEEELRENRLCLLNQIYDLFREVADISEMVQEGEKNDR